MRDRIILFLSNKYNACIVLLSTLVSIDVAALLFVPYKYHLWIEEHRTNLMWLAMVLLAAIIGVLAKKILDYDSQLRALQHQPSSSFSTSDADEMYRFYDEKGELKLLVRSQMVYYIEGADNYVIIYYAKGDKVEHLIVRNTLKNIAWRFRDQQLVRCHRSYIVNFCNVKMLKRTDGEVLLDFGIEQLPNIPVSKTYSELVLKRFS